MPRALGLLLLAGLALAASVRVYPTSPPEREARPGELVTHVFRVEGEGGPYPVKVQSSAGFSILSRPRPVRPPRYLPITVRVPEDAREGTLDVLEVRVGSARATVRTRVGFVPGPVLEAPAQVAFVPPLKSVRIRVENRGNGSDAFVLRVYRGGEELERHRLELGPGESAERTLAFDRPGSYRLVLEELRAGERVERRILLERPRRGPLDPFELVGELALGYAYPGHGLAGSFSLRGALSDYTSLALYAGAARGATPYLSARLAGDTWDFGLELGSHATGRLGLHEGPVRVELAASSAGPWARGSLRLRYPRQQHHFGFFTNDELVYDATGLFYTGSRSLTYRLRWLPRGGPLEFGLTYHGVLGDGGFTLDYQGRLAAGVLASGLSLGYAWGSSSAGLRLGFTGTRLEDWSAAVATTGEALYGRRGPELSLGLEASARRLALDLWSRWQRAPELTAELGAAYRHSEGLTLTGRARLDLPPPYGALVAGARWEPTAAAFYLEADAEPPVEEARLGLSARLAYPWEGTALSARVRFGTSANNLGFSLTGRPFVPELQLGAEAQLTHAGGVLVASARYRWPEGSYAFSAGARFPVAVRLPEPVSTFFGGRKLGILEGRLEPDAPLPTLAGIEVVAGPHRTRTDASGRFFLRLPPGRYRVRLVEATLPAVAVPEVLEREVVLGAKERVRVVFPLSVRGALEGRVEVVGEPARGGSELRLAVEVENAAGRKVVLYTDPRGRFSLPGLRPGVYRVRLLEAFLPPGFVPRIGEVRVRVDPGSRARVLLVVQAPPRRVFRPGAVEILEVRPEVDAVPPGAAPRVSAEIRGRPGRVLVRFRGRILGLLVPAGEPGRWQGRIAVPEDARGNLPLELIAEADGGARARFPFFLTADPGAPWGVVRTLPIVRPGQRDVPVAVRLYAPAKEVVLEVSGTRYPLTGDGADWRGGFEVPVDARGRLLLRVRARLGDGRVVELARWLLVR